LNIKGQFGSGKDKKRRETEKEQEAILWKSELSEVPREKIQSSMVNKQYIWANEMLESYSMASYA
jgi:hypothetical protein